MSIGHLGDVPAGHMKAVEVNGSKLVVANSEGNYFAFDENCTHRRCSLVDGDIDGTILCCPCHGAEFDVRDGSVMEGPAEIPLGVYQVRVVDGEVQVNIP